MTEPFGVPPGFPPAPAGPPVVAGQELTDEQRAFLLAQQARQAVDSPSPAADQAAAAEQMAAGERGPLLPAEEQMDALMAALRAQSEQIAALSSQVGVMQRQQEEAQAAAGGPLTIRYAIGAADKIAALAVARPDHPAGHFDPLAASAGQLVDATTALVRSGGTLQPVKDAAAAVERFITRTHGKAGGAHLDWSAILDDVELAAEEAAKLVAVA